VTPRVTALVLVSVRIGDSSGNSTGVGTHGQCLTSPSQKTLSCWPSAQLQTNVPMTEVIDDAHFLISLCEQCSPQLLNEVERTQASQTDRKA
ncbi:hypothetical protein LEMLEM_LOCUS15041, partial [Lemmus lemmus]